MVFAFLGLLAGSVLAQSNTTPVTGSLGNATVVADNPAGAIYGATMPDSNMTDVRGNVILTTAPGGTGINVQISVSGFPTEGGPFREFFSP